MRGQSCGWAELKGPDFGRARQRCGIVVERGQGGRKSRSVSPLMSSILLWFPPSILTASMTPSFKTRTLVSMHLETEDS